MSKIHMQNYPSLLTNLPSSFINMVFPLFGVPQPKATRLFFRPQNQLEFGYFCPTTSLFLSQIKVIWFA